MFNDMFWLALGMTLIPFGMMTFLLWYWGEL